MRSIWNGNISFGLVSIPIKMYPATEDHSVSFRQIHAPDGGRIRYRKVCELEERQIDSKEIGKAYENADGSMVPITDEDLASLPLPTTRSLEIEAFVPATEIDPLQMGDAYYLGANGTAAAKPYVLLREALKRSEKVAIAKYAHRGRERLGMLRVVGDSIALHRLMWPDEVRQPVGMAPEERVTVKDAELDLADALMATLGEVELATLHDEYHEAVEAMVAAKTSGTTPVVEPGERPAGGQVVDLMAALRDSVRTARKARGEPAGEDAEPADGDKAATADAGDPADAAGGRSADAGSRKKVPAEPGSASDADAESGGEATVTHLAGRRTAKKTAAARTPAKRAAAGRAKTGTDGKAAKSAGSSGAKAAKSARSAKAAEPKEGSGGKATGGRKTAAKKSTTTAAARKQPAKRRTAS